MRRLLLTLSLLLAFSTVAESQISPPTQTVKTFHGNNVTFAWDYLVADEATMTHFSLKWVDSLTGTFIELKTVPKTARTTSISASFTPGFKFTYYAVTAVDSTVPVTVIESLPSNTVALERVGKPPTNARVN
jgi:hypothetical protein